MQGSSQKKKEGGGGRGTVSVSADLGW